MELNFYNTESREKEKIVPLQDDLIRMYTCGPTVYDFAHIGNFRTYVFEDLLRRVFKFFGFRVKQVMNITDVDDKTIRGALKKGVTLKEYTEVFEKAFFEDLRTLNIEPAEAYPRATDYIPAMIKIIEGLLDKGFAYVDEDGSIYYSVAKFEKYGRLSHLKLDELKSSQKMASDEYEKENVADFALWKAYDPERDGNIFWESPFGKGRPGWHIECSAMAMKILGETIDIHVGGVDNMFPHHENEIAQSEAYSGKLFVKHWMHSEHLLVDNKKMSKSLGNFYTLRDLLKRGYSGCQVRYMLMQAHYRTQLNFTFEALDATANGLQRIRDFCSRLHEIKGQTKYDGLNSVLEVFLEKFSQALSDDLNISQALAVFFDLIRDLNSLIDKGLIGQDDSNTIFKTLAKVDSVLGFLPLNIEEKIPEEILDLLQKREDARSQKDWKNADFYRNQILEKGYLIEDTPCGTKCRTRF